MGTWFNGCDTKQAKKVRLSELAKRYHPDLHPEDFERYNRIMAEILAEYNSSTTTKAAPRPRSKPRPEPEPRPEPKPKNRPSDEEIKAAERFYTKETAAMIRRYLKAKFPGVRFYVRQASGGGTVYVEWVDGPTKATVDDTLSGFHGHQFDGMTDSNYYIYSWLLPDGSAVIAGADWIPGGSAFWNPRPHPRARLVSFSPFIFCIRNYSRELLERVIVENRDRIGADAPELIRAGQIGKSAPPHYTFKATTGPMWNVANEYLKAAKKTDAYNAPQPRRTTKTKAPEAQSGGGITITHDRDWTWVTFPGKEAWDALGEEKQAAFKALGFRWSRRRRAWYATRHIEADEIEAAIS